MLLGVQKPPTSHTPPIHHEAPAAVAADLSDKAVVALAALAWTQFLLMHEEKHSSNSITIMISS